jgi:uncharacterized membrane protein (DUF485 family)
MLHEPTSSPTGKDHAIAYKTRLGVQMFIVYALVYAGFVLINIIKPVLMEKEIIFGLNLAVVYGFGLIILAIVMGVIYNAICTSYENKMNKEAEK